MMTEESKATLREFVRSLSPSERVRIGDHLENFECDLEELLAGSAGASGDCWANLVEATVRHTSRTKHVRLLRELLQQATDDRTRIIELLGESGSKRAIEPLVEVLRNGAKLKERVAAVYSLKLIADRRIVPNLTFSFVDPTEPDPVRAEAACALGEVEARGAAPILRSHLMRSPPLVQFWIIYALGVLGDTRALPVLMEFSETADETEVFDGINTLRGEAIWAIDRICEAPAEVEYPDSFLEDSANGTTGYPLLAGSPTPRDGAWLMSIGCCSADQVAITVWGRTRSECAALAIRVLLSATRLAPARREMEQAALRELLLDVSIRGTSGRRGSTMLGTC